MNYLLDTCTVSDFVKGQPQVLARMKATSPRLIAVSVITRMEVDYGLAINPERGKRLAPILEAFFASIITLAFTQDAARESAMLRAVLKTQGRPIGAYDALIAGTALAHGLIVVTSNVGEFGRVVGLQVEDWRTG
ncbi:type II toxin-antitoxin system VapC family toxin [Tepidiphilus margaritifer]|uniref:type II toxin-antitoxin system VapC family toxin n=1 Tax=Tepidiphilus margaritifer TaxID=203471 RepID=UPI00041EED42|nr:type II toxin-antitoxin system VapC family toxin [Tepidiphilus margaritifer]